MVSDKCYCAHCLQYPAKYRVERSTYQDLYPFGLETTSHSEEDTIVEERVSLSSVVILLIKFAKIINIHKKANMAPLTTEDQFTFLISCIRHSSGGKVRHVLLFSLVRSSLTTAALTTFQIDFTKVANECEIITRGAA